MWRYESLGTNQNNAAAHLFGQAMSQTVRAGARCMQQRNWRLNLYRTLLQLDCLQEHQDRANHQIGIRHP